MRLSSTVTLGTFLLLNCMKLTSGFINKHNQNHNLHGSSSSSSSLSAIPVSEGHDILVRFTDVLFPTYVGIAFGCLSYQIDKDPEFAQSFWQFAVDQPKKAAEKIVMAASLGLVTIPPFAALHTMATAGTLTAAGSSVATKTKAAATASSKGLFATKAVTTTAATKTVAAGVALTPYALPISFGLATAYLSYKVDKDPEYAVKTLQSLVDLWQDKVVNPSTSTTTAAVTNTNTPSTVTSGGTIAVGSAASAEVMATGGTLAVGSAASVAVMDAESVLSAASVAVMDAESALSAASAAVMNAPSTSNVAATPQTLAAPVAAVEEKDEPTPVQKTLRVLQSLYFPWLPMFVPPPNSKRAKAIKFAQALYLPWLPMFLPSKKQQQPQQA